MDAKNTRIAIIYDFDKTLTIKDQQEYTFIPGVGMTAEEFWEKSNGLAKKEKMDPILAYMHCMINEAKYRNVPITREAFKDHGRNLEYFPGVKDWFERINDYSKALGADVSHYIISSGLKEIIQGSEIAGNFKEIYACEFYYNSNDVAEWPKHVVNYTTKTQYLFRINKGALDLSDANSLNSYIAQEDRPIPFRNMIYIGDGPTDIPCMKIVKSRGGYSIAVYPDEMPKKEVQNFVVDERVDFIVRANYEDGGDLQDIVQSILLKMCTEDKLSALTKKQLHEISR